MLKGKKILEMRIPEIMAPAGDFPSLSAALRARADSVYFGIRGANMRAGAKNFRICDMKRIVETAGEAGAKAYLTLNTAYFDSDFPRLRQICRSAARAGVSAVIAWDLGAVETAKDCGLEVFLSTQASCSNARSIASYFKNYAIRRFVLARECTLGDIKKIRRELRAILGDKAASQIELEVFAHGAMCVSESGRCFMSQFLCGKSANRGECTQPCRREYFLSSSYGAPPDLKISPRCVMSPKDLCVLPFLEKIFSVGVDALKIEGRNRNPEYVWTTVSSYVRARDFYFENFNAEGFEGDFEELKKDLLASLGKVFNRGFSGGFYMGRPMGDWTSKGNCASEKKAIVGRVLKYYPKAGAADISVEACGFSRGDLLQVEGDKTGFVRFKVESLRGAAGNDVENARKGETVGILVPERLRAGDRIYRFSHSS